MRNSKEMTDQMRETKEIKEAEGHRQYYQGVEWSNAELCFEQRSMQVGMSQVDSLRDCSFYCSSLYTYGAVHLVTTTLVQQQNCLQKYIRISYDDVTS
jgi:hypothetical protein